MIQRYMFSGSGGQGVISAAIILAEAALHYGGLNAVQTQVYGPEARGGSARSDVILADREIYFPKVLEPNILICLSQAAYNKYINFVRPGGIVLLDPEFVEPASSISTRQFSIPMYKNTIESTGSPQTLNMCMLGTLVKLSPVVSKEALQVVIAERFNEKFRDQNIKAVETGYSLVQESVSTF